MVRSVFSHSLPRGDSKLSVSDPELCPGKPRYSYGIMARPLCHILILNFLVPFESGAGASAIICPELTLSPMPTRGVPVPE